MKKIIYNLLIAIAVLTGCKKQQADPSIHIAQSPINLTNIEGWLRAQIASVDYNNIDFTRYHLSKDKQTSYLRFALKNKSWASEFLLIQLDSISQPSEGRWIQMETEINELYKVNGNIRIVSLDGKSALSSLISNGYIQAWHPAIGADNTKVESLVDPYDQLPEVVVYGYRPLPNSGYVFDTYMALQSMFAGGKGSTTYPGATLYSQVNGGGSPTGATGGNSNPSSSPTDNHADYYVSIESSPNKPGIDLEGWLKCFTDIPDAGATCSITLCADLPVDDDPTANVNLYTGATGHCFMELKKTNGAQSVTQVIGFTAQDPMAAINHGDEFVPGKLVNNAGHKYDASITMNVNAAGFNNALEQMKSMSNNLAYSITRFDCLDFDLAVVNSIRGNNPLSLPKMYNTGSTWDVVSTGERFYEMLSDMKMYGDAEAPNILVGGPLYIGTSHGPCN